MTAPIIPLVASYQNRRSYRTRRVEAVYAKGGANSLHRDGINPVVHDWDVQTVIRNKTALDDFLKARKGVEPFEFRWDGTDKTELYKCASWTFTWIGVGVWSFQGRFEQVFRFV